jgi:hypothetical protein
MFAGATTRVRRIYPHFEMEHATSPFALCRTVTVFTILTCFWVSVTGGAPTPRGGRQ